MLAVAPVVYGAPQVYDVVVRARALCPVQAPQ